MLEVLDTGGIAFACCIVHGNDARDNQPLYSSLCCTFYSLRGRVRPVLFGMYQLCLYMSVSFEGRWMPAIMDG